MAQAKAGGFSSKVLGLRFMQRAAEKRKLEEDASAAASAAAEAARTDGAQPTQATDDAAKEPAWSQPSTSGRCIVSYEPIPLPGPAIRTSGRMSFGPNVPKPETQPTGDAKAACGGGTAAAAESQPSVSDAEMANTFRKPVEMRSWQPSKLRIYESAALEGAAPAAGTGRQPAAGAAASRGNVQGAAGNQQSGGAGPGGKKSKGNGGSKAAGGSGSAQGSAQPSNSFAPLRPAKRSKV